MAPVATPAPPPRLLDRLTDALRTRGYVASIRQAYVDWARRYILFHGKRHPQEMGSAEVGAFLEHLAHQEPATLFTLAEARGALLFLYQVVLGQPLGTLPTSVGATGAALATAPRLLDQIRHVLRVRHYARRTEDCYVDWVRRFILFHGKRHPADLGAPHVEAFLTHLAVQGHVSASTQNQALCALVFLYKQVLEIEIGRLHFGPATRPVRLPVVLSRDEVRRVLEAVEGAEGAYRLMADLLYGAGLRRLECCRLRVKDLDLERGQILVRGGKGDKDRVVMLPRKLRPALAARIDSRRALHDRDLARGVAGVDLPDALARKYPKAARELGWQFVFASQQLSREPRRGAVGRHHLHEAALQRAVALAARRAGLVKRVSCHTFRHSKSPWNLSPQVHAPARAGSRRADRAATARPQGRQHGHDLPPRHGERRRRRAQPARPARRPLPRRGGRGRQRLAPAQRGWRSSAALRCGPRRQLTWRGPARASYNPRGGRRSLPVAFPPSEERMARHRLSRNATCPCGSGKKYKHCCWGKGFAWVEDDQGNLFRDVPLPGEALPLLEEQRRKFRQQFGRDMGPDDLGFFDAPPLEQVEHQLVQAMQRAGLDPALIHAFEQTGLLVTEDNQHLIAEQDLQAWQAAVAEYRARHHPPEGEQQERSQP
jgi:integron integrase